MPVNMAVQQVIGDRLQGASSFESGLASEYGSVSAWRQEGISRYSRRSEKYAKIGAIAGVAQR